jgi:hypothetical protein
LSLLSSLSSASGIAHTIGDFVVVLGLPARRIGAFAAPGEELTAPESYFFMNTLITRSVNEGDDAPHI